ncbi:opioid growth factor receptor isoform X2 [Pan paniscus]|uniref:opioid growth factor receptor isoform X2 n=1 Tax=Pan paniscus TaxID=9597 RepID=UPI0015609BA6|nr:opioid growth factor receptor isoform X2 [Pan paniscus]
MRRTRRTRRTRTARPPARGTRTQGTRTRTRNRSSRGRRGPARSRMTGSRNWRATRDMCRYRHNYPDLVERDCNGDTPNLSFYRNEIRFLPNGCFIEDILQNWTDNYDLLEDNHSYIQWLFPLREPGVNWHAKPLTLREVEVFKSSQEIQERLVRAYELMLGFYGIRLEDRGTGTVGRAQNYQKRFQNLNWRSHNNLRITRILKSLGELGLEHFQAPLVRFFLEETLVRRELPGVRQSALDYFMFAVRCRHQRRQLVHFAWEHFRPRCKFVWGPQDKLRRFKPSSLPHPLEGSRKVEEEGSPRDPDHEASTQGRTCGPEHSKGGGRVDEGPQPRSVEPQDAGPLERSQGDEAGGHGEDRPEPLSPKESKKRKLELSRREQPPTEPGPQSASEVEKIALNLEGCALSQGSLRTGTQEVGGQDPGEAVQPCRQPLGARVADKVRKRRKVDEGAGDSAAVASGGAQTLALAGSPAPSGHPKAGHSENGVEEDTEGRTGPKEGTPGSPSETPGPSPAGPSGHKLVESPSETPGPSPAGPAEDELARSPSETPGPSPAGPAGDEPAESPSETPGPSPAGPAGDEPATAGEAAEVQAAEVESSAKSGKP